MNILIDFIAFGMVCGTIMFGICLLTAESVEDDEDDDAGVYPDQDETGSRSGPGTERLHKKTQEGTGEDAQDVDRGRV